MIWIIIAIIVVLVILLLQVITAWLKAACRLRRHGVKLMFN